jgi:hypothetical protein
MSFNNISFPCILPCVQFLSFRFQYAVTNITRSPIMLPHCAESDIRTAERYDLFSIACMLGDTPTTRPDARVKLRANLNCSHDYYMVLASFAPGGTTKS